MTIRTTSKFRKSFNRLPISVRRAAYEKERVFRENPFGARLDTHKLHGKYEDYRSFTVEGQYRIMFAFAGKDAVDFINIGTREIYK